MSPQITFRRWLPQLMVVALLTYQASACLAAKGGNGGKPGGGEELPVYPVQYSITKVDAPIAPTDGFYFADHNNDAAVVGWGYLDGDDGRRALAYLPQVDSMSALTIEDLVPGTDIPTGWHSRSAAGINNFGAIVGNLEPVGGGDARIPFIVRDAYGSQPRLETFGPFDPAANETALRINDNGDVVIWSVSPVTGRTSLFVGASDAPPESFVKIDFESAGLTNPTTNNDSRIWLSDPYSGEQVKLVGRVDDGDKEYLFRVSTDGTDLELLQVGVPLFEDAFGTHSLKDGWTDINHRGDVSYSATVVPSKRGKVKSADYAALWLSDTGDLVPLVGDDPFQWQSIGSQAKMNEVGDSILGTTGSLVNIWHHEWSATTGAVAIADLIDPNDPNRDLFSFALELTEEDATDWPTVIGFDSQGVPLILTPHANVSLLSQITVVPEPSAIALAVFSLLPFVRLREAN